jgi:hypothetical protein
VVSRAYKVLSQHCPSSWVRLIRALHEVAGQALSVQRYAQRTADKVLCGHLGGRLCGGDMPFTPQLFSQGFVLVLIVTQGCRL